MIETEGDLGMAYPELRTMLNKEILVKSVIRRGVEITSSRARGNRISLLPGVPMEWDYV